jgi:hypothetical protein
MNNVQYAKVYYPFSEISYVQGGQKEQVFEVFHTQNILKHFNAGLDFKLINSSGSYLRQKSDITNLFLYAGYQSKDKKYNNKLSYINNILKIQENGGIQYDTVFEQDIETNRKIFTVNLNSAENRIRENTVQFYQELKLINIKKHDSLRASWIKKLIPGHLVHFSGFSSESIVYEDNEPGSLFYPVFPNDTMGILDSIHYRYFKNSISFQNVTDEQYPLLYRFGIKQQYTDYYAKDNSEIIREWGPFYSLTLKLPWEFEYKGEYEVNFITGERTERTFLHEISKVFSLTSETKLNILVYSKYSEKNPSITDSHYTSSLFSWENDFLPLKTKVSGVKIGNNTFSGGLENISRQHHIYFLPSTSIPWQISEDLNYMHAWLKWGIKAGPVFLENKTDYQKISKEDIIHLPEIISQFSLYTDISLFNHALQLQPGFDLFYLSSYFAPQYMPVTRHYYEQSEKKLSEQWYADFFIRFRISRARIFFKYQHFNSVFGAKDYYMVPSYPIQDAGLKFGISWVFRDPLSGKKEINKK